MSGADDDDDGPDLGCDVSLLLTKPARCVDTLVDVLIDCVEGGTVTGGAAERLYERAGWQRVGVVPNTR